MDTVKPITDSTENPLGTSAAEQPQFLVGIGASAGGLEALEQFSEKMAAKTGLDRELTIRKFTPKIAEEFNLLPQDVGRRIDNFAHHIRYDPLMEELRRVLESAQPFEREVQDRHGKWFLLRILPYGSGGSISGVVLTLIDIGSLKDAEARAGQNERQLASILENSPTLVAVKDALGRYVVMNQAFRSFFGIEGRDVVGKGDYDLFPPGLAETLVANDQRVLNEGIVVSAEKALPHPSGPRTCLSVKFPIRDDAGRIRFASHSGQDRHPQRTDRPCLLWRRLGPLKQAAASAC